MKNMLCQGKRQDNGEWVTGFLCIISGSHYILREESFFVKGCVHDESWEYMAREDFVEVVPETVGRACKETLKYRIWDKKKLVYLPVDGEGKMDEVLYVGPSGRLYREWTSEGGGGLQEESNNDRYIVEVR